VGYEFLYNGLINYSSLIIRENDIRSDIKQIEKNWMNSRYYDWIIKNREVRLAPSGDLRVLHVAVIYFIILYCLNADKDENSIYQPLINPIAKIVDTSYSPINEIFFWVQFLLDFLAYFFRIHLCQCKKFSCNIRDTCL